MNRQYAIYDLVTHAVTGIRLVDETLISMCLQTGEGALEVKEPIVLAAGPYVVSGGQLQHAEN